MARINRDVDRGVEEEQTVINQVLKAKNAGMEAAGRMMQQSSDAVVWLTVASSR